MISFWADCSSSFTSSRTILITLVFKSVASEGMISNWTVVPLAPRIKSTTSSKRQPITSTISPSSWPTPVILSAGCNWPALSAGPAGTRRTTLVCSSSVCSTAPMPCNERLILILKFSVLRGEKYAVWGSKAWVTEFMYSWNPSSSVAKWVRFNWFW